MFDTINDVLDEITMIHSALKKNHTRLAKAVFLDFCGDVVKLSEEDRGAACSLLWYEKADEYLGADIHGYYWNHVERRFELV